MADVDLNHLGTLKQRRDWLSARIEAKKKIGWDTIWDTGERDALAWAIAQLESANLTAATPER